MNGGDTDTDTDTDTDGDTDAEDEDKENSGNKGDSKSLDEKRPVHREGPIALSSSAPPEPTTPLNTPGSSNGVQTWIQMRPLSPSMSSENVSVRLTMPDGQPASEAQTSAPVAGDVSTTTTAFQPQQAATPSWPPFSNAPTVQNQNTMVPPSFGLSTLQATDPQISFHSASQPEDPRQGLFGGNTEPTAHQLTSPFTFTSQQPQPLLPTTNALFSGRVQQQFPLPVTNVDSISHPQYQPQFSFCDTDNRFNPRQETPFPFRATAALNTVFEVSEIISFSLLLPKFV